MRRIGMGLIGPGFVGAHHIDAVRRLGFVDVVAVAASTLESAQKKAKEYNVPKAYGSYEELIADPDIHVVHNTTPNYLHAPVNLAVIAGKKHIVSDKPLALDSAEARTMWKAAQDAGVVHAVTFNYRGNPLVQHAREMISQGKLGRLVFIHGAYLQDWLFDESVYSWRLDTAKGGATSALGDIGSHWCDLAQHITGLRIEAVLADLTTVTKTRRRPKKSAEAFAGAATGPTEEFENPTEDLASVLVRFDNGAKGCFSVGQVCAGHKNDLWIEVNGRKESLRWYQEQQNELWIGHANQANELLPKDPSLLSAANRKYAHLPGGHQEGWADAFRNVMAEIYGLILEGKGMPKVAPPAVATFEDGYRTNCIVDSLLESNAAGGVWTRVRY